MADYIIECDGAARGNGKYESGLGVVIMNSSGKVIREIARGISRSGTTNNEAEYFAVIVALSTVSGLLKTTNRTVEVRTDSELVVKQLNGDYRINKPSLQKLNDEIVRLSRYFAEVRFVHIRRELNARADRLANIGADTMR